MSMILNGKKSLLNVNLIEGGKGGSGIMDLFHFGSEEPEDKYKIWVNAEKPKKLVQIEDSEPSKPRFLSYKTNFFKKEFITSTLSCSCQAGNKIYMFGDNVRYNNSQYHDGIFLFDMETKKYTELNAKLPIGSTDIRPCYHDNKIYLFGAWNGGEYHNVIWVYDITNDTISTLNIQMPISVLEMAVVSYNGFIYFFGGQDSSPKRHDTIYKFNPNTLTFELLTTKLAYPCSHMACVLVGDKLYMFGGRNANGLCNTIQVYDFTNDTCTKLSSTFAKEFRNSSAIAIDDNRIMIVGGEANSRYNNYVYNIDNGVIEELISTENISELQLALGKYNGEIYASRGYRNNPNSYLKFTIFSDNYIYSTSLNSVYLLIDTPEYYSNIKISALYGKATDLVATKLTTKYFDGTQWITL